MTKKDKNLIAHTYVNGKRYKLITRKETHAYGRDNGQPDNWWVEINKDYYIPFLLRHDKIYCWEFKFKEIQKTETKWSQTTLRSRIHVDMILNGRKVYEFGARDWGYAFARAEVYRVKFEDHVLNMLDLDSEIGRKIWYKRQLCYINTIYDHGLGIKRVDGKDFDLDMPYDSEEDKECRKDDLSWVKIDFFGDHKWWFE